MSPEQFVTSHVSGRHFSAGARAVQPLRASLPPGVGVVVGAVPGAVVVGGGGFPAGLVARSPSLLTVVAVAAAAEENLTRAVATAVVVVVISIVAVAVAAGSARSLGQNWRQRLVVGAQVDSALSAAWGLLGSFPLKKKEKNAENFNDFLQLVMSFSFSDSPC